MQKQSRIKNYLIILVCLLFSAANVFAVEGQTPAEDTGAVKKAQRPGAVRKENNPEESAKGMPPKLPSKLPPAVTPAQIKAFFSRPKENNYIILNFDNADLKDVINTVASITNENFILSPGLEARITIHSTKKIPVSEVMNVFESVLEANGMALVKSGEFLKIVSGTTAKQKPLDVRKGNQAESIPAVDRPVTQIVPVEYVPATEVSTVLTPMLSQFGSIIPNPRNNLLIINDISSNIIRLLKVLKELDVNAFKNTRMSFFKPKYSDVLSLSNELTEVLNALNLSREGIALVPIERINSLVIFSASPTLLKTVQGWVRKLDEEVMTGQNIFVYAVQNVKAESIAGILNSLYDSSGGTRPKARKTKTAKRTKTSRRTVRTTRPQQTSAAGRVEIIAFEPTNSIVILASPGIYREIVSIIKKLDTYPKSVLIEVVIAEVTLSDSDKLGIQWSVLHNLNIANKNYTGLAERDFGDNSFPLSADAPSLGSGLAGGLSYILYRPEKLTALFQAIASKSRVNILSSPRLLVRDQEEASIEVGGDVPTATSSTSSTTTDSLTQNIEYKTVGIKLKIKPTINDEKTVVLDIEQEVSDVIDKGRTVGGLDYPEFTTRKAKTSIVVPDKQGIVIGGIIEESREKSSQGIPLLSSIPLLGRLFSYDSEDVVKKELIIMITPYVIVNKTEGNALTTEFLGKLKEIKSFLDKREALANESSPGEK
ncbi:MAG TPA: type II secretion system protein GspD [Nitrospirae bacterium]|nr:type II secretion system protein GspD [Nitrospirota bacterium]HDZ00560.1 type II secretion system protein GspD [Nitrospirota bacterium]